MKRRGLIILLCLLAGACTQDREWDNPCDAEGTAEPTAPSELKATALNDTTIELTWQDSQQEMGYRIECGIDGALLQEIGSVPQDTTRFVLEGLPLNHLYSYRIIAFSANGREASEHIEFQHSFLGPSNLALTQASESKIRLEWKDNSVFEHGFRIERKQEGGDSSRVDSVESNVTVYMDEKVELGKTYIYLVNAFTLVNESSPVVGSIKFALFAPSDLFAIAQVSGPEIRLEWKDNSSSEDGFKIERREGPTEAFVQVATVSTNIQTYTDSDVSLGTQYTYRVRAFNLSSESDAVEAPITGDTVTFASEGLTEAVRREIRKWEGAVLLWDVIGLTYLDASGYRIESLNGIEKLGSITDLNLSENWIEDLTPLSKLTSLKKLTLIDNSISNLSALSWLTSLELLSLLHNQITSLAPLSKLTSLRSLYLQYNQIVSLAPLSGLTSLRTLYLGNNQIVSLAPLSGLTSLKDLDLNHNQISDIWPLAGLKTLEELDLRDNQISDISALFSMNGLKEVFLQRNPLSSTAISVGIPNLRKRGVYVGY